jgi:hypothetical protein
MDDVLALVDRLRRHAYDRSLAPDDAMRRIRDELGERYGVFDDPATTNDPGMDGASPRPPCSWR